MPLIFPLRAGSKLDNGQARGGEGERKGHSESPTQCTYSPSGTAAGELRWRDPTAKQNHAVFATGQYRYDHWFLLARSRFRLDSEFALANVHRANTRKKGSMKTRLVPDFVEHDIYYRSNFEWHAFGLNFDDNVVKLARSSLTTLARESRLVKGTDDFHWFGIEGCSEGESRPCLNPPLLPYLRASLSSKILLGNSQGDSIRGFLSRLSFLLLHEERNNFLER